MLLEGITMPRWDDDDLDDDEEEFNSDDDDEAACIPCPYCGGSIHEDSQRCPRCGSYISKEDAPPSRKPWWLIIGVIACLLAIARWNHLL